MPQQHIDHDTIPNSIGAGAGATGLFSFSSIKSGAGGLFKNLKDTSSKVIQSVQQTIARTDLDISAITSRVLVMPCPSEGLESAYKTNNIEDVKVYIESRYALGKVSVYNFGPRSCPRLPPPVRTVEGSFVFPLANKAPLLQGMYSLVEDMYGFLSADPKSIVIIQSADNGRATAATMVKYNPFFLILSLPVSRFLILTLTSLSADLCIVNLCKSRSSTGRCSTNICCSSDATEFTTIRN